MLYIFNKILMLACIFKLSLNASKSVSLLFLISPCFAFPFAEHSEVDVISLT